MESVPRHESGIIPETHLGGTCLTVLIRIVNDIIVEYSTHIDDVLLR